MGWDSNRRVGVISGDNVDAVREAFSVENQDKRFSNNPFVASRKYAITPTFRFETGLTPTIASWIRSKLPGTEIVYSPELISNLIHPVKTDVYDSFSIKLRDYQKDIIQKCLNVGRGTVLLATAGGKTLTTGSLIACYWTLNPKLKCLVLVPDIGLVKQTFSDFNEYKVPFSVSMWSGKEELNLGTNVIIANLGILQKTKSNTDWIEDVDLFIIDEVHKLRQSNKINKIIKSVRTPYKYGLTGTLPPNLLDQWNIIGKIGPILFEKSANELQKEGYVAPAKAVVIKVFYKTRPPKLTKEEMVLPNEAYRQEMEFLFNHPFRNKVISALCVKLENNALILVDRIEHGETLFKTLTEQCVNKRVFFIRGDVEVDDRRKVIELMENNQNVIAVAISKIFSTGINIKQLPYIIFAAGGKAKVRVIQSIGRGRRLHENKVDLTVIDIADQLKYGSAHAFQRLKLYSSEKIPFAYREVYESGTTP